MMVCDDGVVVDYCEGLFDVVYVDEVCVRV